MTAPAQTDPSAVPFTARDGKLKVYSFAELPVPHLHPVLSDAFAARIASGAMTTTKAADAFFLSTTQFLHFLGEFEQPPAGIDAVQPEHLEQFLYFRCETRTLSAARYQVWDACRLLRYVTPEDQLSPQLRAYLAQPRDRDELGSEETWPGRGRNGVVPAFGYERYEREPDNALIVPFTAQDGQRRAFDFSVLPMASLHADLAAAFRTHLGLGEHAQAGVRAAVATFTAVRRFLEHLAATDLLIGSVADLTPQHLDVFASRRDADNAVRMTLRRVRPYERLSAELRRALEQPRRITVLPHRVPDSPAGVRPQRPGRGRTSAMPDGPYEPDVVQAQALASLTVLFHGEDDRPRAFDFTTLPLPGLHGDLAAAFATRTGATGTIRTSTSASYLFSIVRRFLDFLDGLRQPPASVADLTPRHIDRFRLHRLQTVNEGSVNREVWAMCKLLRAIEPSDRLTPEMFSYITSPYRNTKTRHVGTPGYSDREFRDLVSAARSDVVAIRDRVRKGEQLLADYRRDPDQLGVEDRTLGARLDEMDRTGHVPLVRAAGTLSLQIGHGRLGTARHLFLTEADLTPLIVLGVALTGRNAETLKELPAEHRLLEDRAVAVTLVKRRRAKADTRETVHWETGRSDSRQLHTPGGFYLLLHQLTERGRRFSGNRSVWSMWSGLGRPGTGLDKQATAGHSDPFAVLLTRSLHLNEWARGHGLTDDSGQPLKLTLNRVKTAVEVRHTKAMGGHLPSASRTNTLDVSFAHYLQGDPTVREWAEEVMTAALDDAENVTRTWQPTVVNTATAQALAQPDAPADPQAANQHQALQRAQDGTLDTVTAACLDIDHNPHNEGRCATSFLTCLRCPNALITPQHLPGLLSTVDTLDQARQEMDLDAWVSRHGREWLVLTRHILPKFTDAEKDQAATSKPQFLPLDLLDGPKEI